ncbi:FecR family protein [Steroidobacter flavus]|uniref:FecR family protein n=1 Tax=Steroidobacter flavus TaxID=1842136 RepID=A0ABV8T580_9GAMM
MNPTPEQRAVIRQAVEWHQLINDGGLDQNSRREFRSWLQASPSHVHEFARICALEVVLQGSLKKGVPRALPGNVINFDSYACVTRRPPPPQMPTVTLRFNTKKIAVAASVVLAVIVTLFASLVSTDKVIVTQLGHWDKQLLEDGTVVYAGPRTKLRFHFNGDVRSVRLVRGEALFEVAKELGRPFIVSTDAGTVQAVGTEFATADRGDTVVVTVAEGKVIVTATAIRDGMQSMTPVVADQQVVLSPTGASAPAEVNAERELKWIRDWYEYDGERVGDIVAQINLRNDVQVVVDDPQVARLRLNQPLTFKPSQPEDFVRKVNRWYENYPQKTGGQTGAKVLHLERS